jgi:transcriptional regulator with XRE-family HTH domain
MNKALELPRFKLREWRTSRGLSARKLALGAGVKPNTIGDLERDSFRQPNRITANKLADYFGVTVFDLYRGPDDSHRLIR